MVHTQDLPPLFKALLHGHPHTSHMLLLFFLIKRKDNSEKPEEISEILRTIFLGNAGFFRFWKDKEIQIAYIM